MYPIILDIKNEKCVIIGGGHIAVRKAKKLIESQAVLTIIAPEITEEMQILIDKYNISYVNRKFQKGDLQNARIVICAVGKYEIDELVKKEAKKYNCLLNIVDNPNMGNFHVPASFKEKSLLFTISTDGKSPALSKIIKNKIANELKNYALWLDIVEKLRQEVRWIIPDNKKREMLWRKVLSEDIMNLVEQGKLIQAEEEVRRAISSFGTKS